MPAMKPTAAQVEYLRYFAERDEEVPGWTINPLAAWRAIHPEGTELSAGQLLWRVKKQFTAMKSQGWVTETNIEHHYQDDAVNSRRFEETLYRITERGRRALIESGNSPVRTRKVATMAQHTDHDATDTTGDAPETVHFADGPAHGRTVTLPAGRHDQVLFVVAGRDVRYRRSRRPAVDGHAVFVPAQDEMAEV